MTERKEQPLVIRPVTPADTPRLVELTEGTGVFRPIELVALREVLDDYHATNQAQGHRALACDEPSGRTIGYIYFAPAAMTDRTWSLWWIAIDKSLQTRGIGSSLLERCEAEVRAANGRLLLIETSSLDHYTPTRQFYLKHGYQQESVLHDYYAAGDHMVVFGKRFGG